MSRSRIALVGNPNVGKSTIFNALTGMRQHTGNWPGKTVTKAMGHYKMKQREYEVIDLPGTYSLYSNSQEETITREYIQSMEFDKLVVVLDATALRRTLLLGLQIARQCKHVLFVVNLMDEAYKKGVQINIDVLSQSCGIPTMAMQATSKKDIQLLKQFIEDNIDKENELLYTKDSIELQYHVLQEICNSCIVETKQISCSLLDKYLIHPFIGPILMLGMLLGVCYLTIAGANIPASMLGEFFSWLGEYIRFGLIYVQMSAWWLGFWMDGIYLVLSFVISVMFPPVVIFFTLFSFLEEYGLLPRIAFYLDGYLAKCHGHGKQALCMCMGLGCNCVGVTGCRIMENRKDRDIGIITNSLMPCNGRFPMIITIASIFFVANKDYSLWVSSCVLTFCICLSIASVFLLTYLLSVFLYKGERGSFILELPPYRMPNIKNVLMNSLFHKSIRVLGRAVLVSSIAGALMYCMSPYLSFLVTSLNPIGYAIGVDGAVIASFLLGIPANEIVLPILLMLYKESSILTSLDLQATRELLLVNGWTLQRAVCFIVLVLFHFPCATTLLTVYKETKSKKTLVLSFLVPVIYGVILCFIISKLG